MLILIHSKDADAKTLFTVNNFSVVKYLQKHNHHFIFKVTFKP